jgi:Domain of unknown function (DUF4388)
VKLEGSLDAFSLPDIFQLLSFTKKSGGLHLRRANTHGCVYFRDGSVTGAISDDGRQALARRLVGSAAVGDNELAAAVDRAANEGVGVGRALLDAGALDVDFLRGMVAEQAVDAVFDFLRWADGDFSFTVDEPGPDDVGVSLGVEPIVNDARSRLESWDHACRIIPSPDTVLALPVAVRDDPQVSRGEWALLALVDGRRSVADLVALAGRGDFAVVSQLAALVGRGLLAVRTPDSEEGALALARRHAILGKLETNPPAFDALRSEPPAGQAEFAPSPSASVVDAGESHVRDDGRADSSVFAGGAFGELSANSAVASVLAAAANAESSPFARTQAPAPRETEHGGAERSVGGAAEAIGARLVADTRVPVIPARPQPFIPARRPDFPEHGHPSSFQGMGSAMAGGSAASAAVAAHPADSDHKSHIERDPSVNKSLLLRLIAGVRGL